LYLDQTILFSRLGFLPYSCGGALICWKTCFDGAAARCLLLTFMFDLCRYWSPILVLMFTLSKPILLGSVSFGMNRQRTATYWKVFGSIFFAIFNSYSQTSSNLAAKHNFFQSLTFQSLLGAQKTFLRAFKTYSNLWITHSSTYPSFALSGLCLSQLLALNPSIWFSGTCIHTLSRLVKSQCCVGH
jgi:hypothetical protein